MTFTRVRTLALNFLHTARTWVVAHKLWSLVIAAALLYGGSYAYGKVMAPSTTPRYVTTTIATGTVVASITETGQVSATNQVDVNAKATGQVLSLLVSPGDHVAMGAAIAYLDPTTAQKEVRDAQANLEAARLSLQKLQEPTDQASLTASQNSVSTAQAAVINARTTGYNDVSSTFLDLPTVMTGIDTILHGTIVPGRTSEQNENAYNDMVQPYDSTVTQYQTAAENAYQKAYVSYTKALSDFKATPRSAGDATLDSLVQESYGAAADLSDALKASTNFLNFVNTTLANRQLNIPIPLPGQISSLTTYTNQTNGHVATLLADINSVTSNGRALVAAQASLTKTQTGTDPIDLQSSQLSVTQKQNSLTDAQTDLANTVVRAPFSGTIASIALQKYQSATNGGAVALMVSDNQSVNISVNEVDAAKLKVGEKATITFDALPNLSIAGTVSSVNAIGTVSSGVVSYSAVITFDTPNTTVKPGMSATANIVVSTETGPVVPARAIKTTNGQSYVQVFTSPLAGSENNLAGVQSAIPPIRVSVTSGLTDGTNTIVEHGVASGTDVVTQTLTSSAAAAVKTSAAQSTSLFGGGGGKSGGGGGVRVLSQ